MPNTDVFAFTPSGRRYQGLAFDTAVCFECRGVHVVFFLEKGAYAVTCYAFN